MLDTLCNMAYFSYLDLDPGYWQVTFDPGSSSRTTFTTRRVLYDFIRIPFYYAVPPFNSLFCKVACTLGVDNTIYGFDNKA